MFSIAAVTAPSTTSSGTPRATSYSTINGPPRRGRLLRLATRRQWCSPIRNTSSIARPMVISITSGGTIALASAMTTGPPRRGKRPRPAIQRRWHGPISNTSSIEAPTASSTTSFGMNRAIGYCTIGGHNPPTRGPPAIRRRWFGASRNRVSVLHCVGFSSRDPTDGLSSQETAFFRVPPREPGLLGSRCRDLTASPQSRPRPPPRHMAIWRTSSGNLLTSIARRYDHTPFQTEISKVVAGRGFEPLTYRL